MSTATGHKHTGSITQNHKAQLANAYNELGKELSSTKIKVVGNYTLGKIIGEGAYGKVRMGTHRLTSTRVAIKQIPKAMSASLTREIHHHRQLHHPHVTQMYEVIATESSIWIVTELCSGGELFDYLAEKGRLTEDETKIIFGQLCLAVAYLHEKGVVHRDLKLENVLLDERCRVKLGDFGFTREFERNNLMETFCGTTGYAAPEMLECKKYLGAEVDIWSLGIILYCLLTGTLPFDDDDESVMRLKIIKGDFEDPEWLSLESRDLIKNVLQKDPSRRLTISQILAHSWFTDSQTRNPSRQPTPLLPLDPTCPQLPQPSLDASPLSAISDLSFMTASSELTPSTPTTPDESHYDDPFDIVNTDHPFTHHNLSEKTLKKAAHEAALEALEANKKRRPPATVLEEEEATPTRPSVNSQTNSFKEPPAYPARTPARTKHRSVSSTLSDPASPTLDKPLTPLPPQDFSSLLHTPAPMIFSTPLERDLLNNLSALGFDTAQIVHSVLSDACDAAGAVWWMLRRKAEKKALEEGSKGSSEDLPKTATSKPSKHGVSVQTEVAHGLNIGQSAPEFTFMPPTPTVSSNARPKTPPTATRSIMPYLSPSGSSFTDTSVRSNPTTPSGSVTDRQGSKGRREGKVRSGSVSIMQRANTALEAVGIVRKKSSEVVKEDKEKTRDHEKKSASGEETRSSHGSASSSKRPKSPSAKGQPSTPSVSPELKHAQPVMGSPWVMAGPARSASPHSDPPTPSNSPGDTLASLPNFSENGTKVGAHRNRASLLTTFRLWFNEDRKGKRKEPTTPSPAGNVRGVMHTGNRGVPVERGSVKRRTSANANATRKGTRAKRGSVSSRRSSSVNSRRSSGASAHVIHLESPHLMLEQIPSRLSYGSHTPNSERGEYPSRPSSIRSISMQPRHRKSPSASSTGSAHFRTTSPLQKYHRRGGSGSSTRVVRQQAQSARPSHGRSNSATSSIHSRTSSRPTSYYEPSEGEGQRTSSPYKTYSRRSDDTPRRAAYSSNTTFVAQKRQTPFTSPLFSSSYSRSSWKKSWGLEPPGWQSRTTHLPIEVLAISPAIDSAGSIRDVFSGRQSVSMGDESDWVDEEDESPFAVGLGQTPTSAGSFGARMGEVPVALSPPPRMHGGRTGKRRGTRESGGRSQKAGHSPAEPVQQETTYETQDVRGGGRRQLPTGRSGPAFRHPIQEEDEEEEG